MAEVHNGPCQKLFGVGCSELAPDAILQLSVNNAARVTLQCPDQLLLFFQPVNLARPIFILWFKSAILPSKSWCRW